MKEKNWASLNSLKKGVDLEPDPLFRGTDPDPHENVMDPEHCLLGTTPLQKSPPCWTKIVQSNHG
jgi:hypothetical protein